MPKPGETILLKLSGEVLGRSPCGEVKSLSSQRLEDICAQISALHQYRWAIVVGGGNFLRGAESGWCRRSTADQMGMLATAMNGLALQATLERLGTSSQIFSCGVASGVGSPYDAQSARGALSEGRIVICVGGTGCGYVTTDTTSVLRACELEASYILKGSFVEGVYDRDPRHHPNAEFLPRLTYARALQDKLQVMDLAAFALAEQFKKRLLIFSILESRALERLLEGTLLHTQVHP